MRLGLRIRFWFVRGLLVFARWWAGRFVASAGGRAFGGASYDPTLLPELGGDCDWARPSHGHLPPEERYPWRVAIPKQAVVLALSVRLPGADRWPPSGPPPAIYRGLGLPDSADATYLGDESIAWLRLAGPNAGWLTVEPGGAIVLDYRALLTGIDTAPGRFMSPCRALFVPIRGGLELVEIAMRKGAGEQRITPADGAAWTLAKLHLQNADMLVHEVVSHFLWTHCHADRIILATVGSLPAGHPIRTFLAPHFAFTLVANENSARVLLGPGGIFDRLFSPGWPGIQQLLRRGEQAWQFSRMVPHLDAEERRVTLLADYPYRDDAVLVWNALSAHVARANLPYDGPAAAWGAELRRQFGGSFPVIENATSLNLAVTASIFTTVRHTLVNAAQYASFGYPPHWPAMLCRPFPEDPRTVDAAYICASLPNVTDTLDAIRATFAFSIQFTRLKADDAGLSAVAAELERRNALRTRPYTIAEPGRISNSINA